MNSRQGQRSIANGDSVGLAIAARIIMAVGNASLLALGKAVSLAGVTPGEMLFARNAFALPFVALWIAAGPGFSVLRTTRPRAHLVRSTIGMISMVSMFTLISLLPLAEVTAFIFTTPIFATIFSATLLRDKVGWHRWTAIGLGVIGMLLLTQPGGNESISAIGITFGFGTAILMAGVTITVRQLGTTEPPGTTVFWFTAAATVVTGLFYPFFYQNHPLYVWGLLLALGFSGSIIQIAATTSLRLASVSVTAPFDYLQLPLTMLLGWLIWNDFPTAWTIAGAALIGGAGLYTIHRERKLRRAITSGAPIA